MQLGSKIEHHTMKAMLYKKYCRHMVKVKTNSPYYRPKRSSNKIPILQTKFEFGKKRI